MRRLLCASFIVAVVSFAPSRLASDAPQEGLPPGVKGSYTIETARVEEVFKVVDDDYRFVAYIVVWHGQRVVVSDPLAGSDHAIGDTISFMAGRTDMPSSPRSAKLLYFHIMGP